jgi:TPR repeat protein
MSPRSLALMTGAAAIVAACASSLAACAFSLPRAEVDRCNLGVADGNDAFTLRQGPACASLAARLAAHEDPEAAVGYARKACQLQDARGCEEYLGIVRGTPAVAKDELQSARVAGEKACAGMVVTSDGVDARPPICAKTAELYVDLEPRSPDDAGRLYSRACDLGDSASCARATSLGAPAHGPAPAHAPASAHAPAPAPAPARASVPVCHDLRVCVALDVKQRNTSEVLGTLTNHCDRPVFCSFCPARGAEVDKSACHTTTLAPSESKSGREAGLWYDGYTAIAFDCSDAADDRSCTP